MRVMIMKLTDREWKIFNFSDVFDIQGGFYNKKPPKEKNGTIPFLGASGFNNGITEFYTLDTIKNNSKTGSGKNEKIEQKIYKGNCICVANNGVGTGSSFYQVVDFTCSHDVNPLYLKNYTLNENIALFLIPCIKAQKMCFEYSRKWRPSRMKNSKFMLPTKDGINPDWEFMDEYISAQKRDKKNSCTKYINDRLNEIKYRNIPLLKEKSWRTFFLSDICYIESGQDIYADERKEGDIPYLSSGSQNNGVGYFVSNSNQTLEANAISINRNGSVGYAFYHKYPALYSNDCRKLKLKEHRNEYVSLFITNQIMQQKDKYNYGYKMGTGRLQKQLILLPINDMDEPDYEYMEQYIKNLMISKYKKYITTVSM